MKKKPNALRIARIIMAAIFFLGITMMFLDVTGVIHKYLGWMAKIQFLPALLALNAGIVVGLILLTLVFGRVYCSVICPLGVMQDIISWGNSRRKKKYRFRFKYTKARQGLRAAILVIFILTLALGGGAIAHLIAPYSAYGRIAENIFAPLYALGNNFFAWIAERFDSYAFYTADVWIKSIATFVVAAVSLIVIFVFAWKGGRSYCNTICPVGTILGWLSKYSLFGPTIDTSKCKGCTLCGRRCKASCIDMENHAIDYTRCVACMDCIDVCDEGAIKYRFKYGKNNVFKAHKAEKAAKAGTVSGGGKPTRSDRRAFITGTALAVGSATLKAQEMKVDGGLAAIEGKKVPVREVPLKPAGSLSLKHFTDHCTGCQLCVANCPNGVLRPSTKFETFMQPEMSYERGYCRPECNNCSQVCPVGAIRPVSIEEKSSISIGHAVIDLDLCVVPRKWTDCGNCARHCPAGAIRMVKIDPDDPESLRIPTVIPERCIGCGACENLCPSRPFSAIHIEGNEVHRNI